MALLLLLVLTTQAADAAGTSAADPELSSVPAPTNVTIEAYNLNTVLYWSYPVTLQMPVFTVQVKTYGESKWTDVCNTSHRYCNISSMVDDPVNSLWARVKARLGQEESAYAESEEFIFCRQWKVGPPKLRVRQKEDQIMIDVFDPFDIVNEQELEAIYDEENTCYSFIYNVYVRINGTQISNKMYTLKGEDCNETQCHLTLPVTSLSSNYCVSAEGFSRETWPVKTEKSRELCIAVFDHKNMADSIWIPIVAAVLLFLVFVLLVGCYNIKKINPFKRKTIMLPKSLVSVVKNASSEAKSESKYISPITYTPIIPENEKVICEEPLSPTSTSSAHTEDYPRKAEHGDLASEMEVVITEENTSNMAPDSSPTSVRKVDSVHSSSNQSEPCSIAFNCYHSRNGSDSLVALDSLSDAEFPPNNKNEINTGEPEPIILRNTTTSFGYEPHVLVDLPVDEGGKESLIGYRVTAGSQECS